MQSSSEIEPPLTTEEIRKFIPEGYPQFLEDGRVPLRVQIFNQKPILTTVLRKPKKGVYMCSHCDNLFVNFGELLDHFDEFGVRRPHKCVHDDCPWKIVGFNRLRQLVRHLNSVHSSEKEYRCIVPGCNKNFGRLDLLNRHVRSVHNNINSRFNRKILLSSTNSSPSPSNASNSPMLANILSPAEQQPHPSTSQTSHSPPKYDSDDSTTQDNSENNYKHSIKFLTNSDD